MRETGQVVGQNIPPTSHGRFSNADVDMPRNNSTLKSIYAMVFPKTKAEKERSKQIEQEKLFQIRSTVTHERPAWAPHPENAENTVLRRIANLSPAQQEDAIAALRYENGVRRRRGETRRNGRTLNSKVRRWRKGLLKRAIRTKRRPALTSKNLRAAVEAAREE